MRYINEYYSQISHTEVAEHLVSSVQSECNIEELYRKDKKHLEIEIERLHSKLEHLKAQNNTLQISLRETKENCERYFQQTFYRNLIIDQCFQFFRFIFLRISLDVLRMKIIY